MTKTLRKLWIFFCFSTAKSTTFSVFGVKFRQILDIKKWKKKTPLGLLANDSSTRVVISNNQIFKNHCVQCVPWESKRWLQQTSCAPVCVPLLIAVSSSNREAGAVKIDPIFPIKTKSNSLITVSRHKRLVKNRWLQERLQYLDSCRKSSGDVCLFGFFFHQSP